MNLKDLRRLQGQVFALQAFLNSVTQTLEKTDPRLFAAVVAAARPVLDDVKKSWEADDPMVAGFVEAFECLLGNKGPPLPPPNLRVLMGGKE